MLYRNFFITFVLGAFINAVMCPVLMGRDLTGGASATPKSSPTVAGSGWGFWEITGGVAGLLAVGAVLYTKVYQRSSRKSTIKTIRDQYIFAPATNPIATHEQRLTFKHWRVANFSVEKGPIWESAAELKRAKFQVKRLLLDDLHLMIFKDQDGKVVPNTLTPKSTQPERVSALPYVAQTIAQELKELGAAMFSLSKIDPSLPSIASIFRERLVAKSTVFSDSFDPESLADWTPAQEEEIEKAMKEKCKRAKWGQSWFEWIWYKDPYYKARKYYWKLFKYKQRLQALQFIVEDMMSRKSPEEILQEKEDNHECFRKERLKRTMFREWKNLAEKQRISNQKSKDE